MLRKNIWRIAMAVFVFCFSFVAGCAQHQPGQIKLPAGLSIEEHSLTGMPSLDPLTFAPKDGIQVEILAKHAVERAKTFPDNSILTEGQPGFEITLGGHKITALQTFTNIKSDQVAGVIQKVDIQVLKDGNPILSFPSGVSSPVNSLTGLWSYKNHWIIESAYVDQSIYTQNDVEIHPVGNIIQDGINLNQKNNYSEAFGFQLMNSIPFYFYERGGRIGISYDGTEIPLDYSQVIHYQCCSGSQLNPRQAENLVAFFAQKNSDWYYVEIGVFK